MPVYVSSRREQRVHRTQIPGLLTRPEAARYLGVSVSSLGHWSRHGRGPKPQIIGQSSYYDVRDIDAWAADRAGKQRGEG